jgi:hypothetical protein
LAAARAALGEDWVPEGAVAEGDVERKMHHDATPLSGVWQSWSGDSEELDVVFGRVETAISKRASFAAGG